MGRKNRNLVFVLSLLLIVGFLVTSLVSYFVSRESLRTQIKQSSLPLTSDTVYSEVQRDLMKPIFISSLMAQDTFLRDWVLLGEKSPKDITRYLKEIQKRYNTVSSFFVSEKSRLYYHADGLLKTVKVDEERDRWYFRVREMENPYEINIDPDMANRDAMTVFINYRVFDYADRFIGVTGVGLTVNAVRGLLDSYKDKYDREIYFTNRTGEFVLSGSSFPEKLRSLDQKPGVGRLSEQILADEGGKYSYHNGDNTVHLNSRYIPEFGWYLFIEQSEEPALRDIFKTLIGNLLICAVLTGVVLYFVIRTVKAYQANIETLRGIVPICAYCKKVRDDQGYWSQVEAYVAKFTEAQFSHAYCPDCLDKHYPDYKKKITDKT
ncbi:MAG: hypothetical protein C0623_04555 [Desulfuromonas sp.]|nr:MAG: hypothetical protein C0623_04555 [Desulfuromonas sp.]